MNMTTRRSALDYARDVEDESAVIAARWISLGLSLGGFVALIVWLVMVL